MNGLIQREKWGAIPGTLTGKLWITPRMPSDTLVVIGALRASRSPF